MYYFAYGSNMDVKRLFERIGREPEKERACLKGYTLTFNKIAYGKPKQGYANIESAMGGEVHGILYLLTSEEMSLLDNYEGASGGHYYRELVEVNTASGNIKAVTYIAYKEKTAPGLLPSGEYLNHLLCGRDMLQVEYYERLLSQKTIDE